MAVARKAFKDIQISSPEVTNGTAVAATEVVVATISAPYTDKIFHTPEEDRGSLAKNFETPIQVSDEIEIELEGNMYDRLAVFLFNMAIRGNVTPTQPDNINEPLHYLWTLEPSLTGTGNTPDETNGIETFTIEYGDNVQHYETEFTFATKIEITGEPGELCTFSATIMGRQSTESTQTPALSAPTVVYFPFNLAKIYIDTSYANLGTTQKTDMLKGFTWTLETMFTGRYTADGNFYFTALNEEKKAAQLELTYIRSTADSETAKDIWESQATTFIRIEMNGETEMDAGQANPPYIRLDGAYKYTEWPVTDDEDGTSIVSVTAETFYDTTSSKQFGVLIGTTMAAFT